jgi:hypothetical protein
VARWRMLVMAMAIGVAGPAAATLEFRDQSGVDVRVMRASFVVSLLWAAVTETSVHEHE